MADDALAVRIAALQVYPVKSCAGLALDAVRLVATGFAFDRGWMLVDGEGEFLSQRELPRLALVQCALTADALVLRAPGMPALELALDAVGTPLRVRIWDDVLPARDLGEPAARWFGAFLRQQARLVRFDPAQRRLSNRAWTGGCEAENAFSDGFPILVLSQASLAALNERLVRHGGAPVTLARFRPNLVLDGLDAHGEDWLDDIVFDSADGPVRLQLAKPCPRCPIPDIDPATGVPDAGPAPRVTEVLAGYRADDRVGGAVSFGMNAFVTEGLGRVLRVGQAGRARLRF